MDSEEDPPASEGIIRNVSVRIFKMVSLISPQNKINFLIVEYLYNMLSKKFENPSAHKLGVQLISGALKNSFIL